MLTCERHEKIRAHLAESKRVLAGELAVEFGISEDTARRDLRELARLGLCKRVYGGAVAVAPDLGPIAGRQLIMPQQKARLGSLAASLIKPNQTVLVDAGSTNIAVVSALPRDIPLTVITNAPSVALALQFHQHCKIILIGGVFNAAKGACLGSQALRDVQMIHADVFVLGSCGVDPDAGLTSLDAEEAHIKRCMVEHSSSLLVAATSDKLGAVAPYHVADVGELDHLVINSDASPELKRSFYEQDITIHQLE